MVGAVLGLCPTCHWGFACHRRQWILQVAVERIDWGDLLLFVLHVLAGEEACVLGLSLHKPRGRTLEGRGHGQHGCNLEELRINACVVGSELGAETWLFWVGRWDVNGFAFLICL